MRTPRAKRPAARKAAATPAPRITAAICTYDRYDLLANAIRSLERQALAVEAYDILVIDNSPDPARSAKEAEPFRSVPNLLWRHESVAGLSVARNAALGLARTELIAFLDDDAIAGTGWLQSLCGTFDALGGDCLAVGGRVKPIWDQPRPAWLMDELLGYLSVVDLGDTARLLRPGEWVAGANIAFRVRALRELGGFDVTLGRIGSTGLMSNEEVALLDKIRERGGSIGYDPGAIVDHLVDNRRLTQTWFRRRAAWQAVSDSVQAKAAASPQQVEQRWDAVKDYFLHWPPADRSIRALTLNLDDPSRMRWQMATVYDVVQSLLSGIGETDDD